jgi:outer membrane receptor protein involved in Fe transport
LTRSNLFRFDQQVHALFVTYERPLGPKLTALAGLRGELTQIDLDQVTQGQTDENDYARLYPSLHLAYQMDDARRLTASYSRRVQRPPPQAYNAFRTYNDPQNFSQGNPNLKPQVTDSFEAGYQYRKRGTILLATAYYRHGQDAVNSVVRDLGGGVVLQTQANVGRFQSAGVEFVANGRLPKKISYNISGNLLWSEIDAASLGFGSRQRSGFTPSGRASLNWDATDKDTLQVQGFVNGKRLTPQGHAQPSGALNLGYKHKFRSDLSGVVTVQDVLATQRFRNVTRTGTYREVTDRKSVV